MIEAVPAATGLHAAAVSGASNVGNKGSEGVFYTLVGNRKRVAANPAALFDWDTIVQRLDKQGSIEENAYS
jgi:hypothetical protein